MKNTKVRSLGASHVCAFPKVKHGGIIRTPGPTDRVAGRPAGRWGLPRFQGPKRSPHSRVLLIRALSLKGGLKNRRPRRKQRFGKRKRKVPASGKGSVESHEKHMCRHREPNTYFRHKFFMRQWVRIGDNNLEHVRRLVDVAYLDTNYRHRYNLKEGNTFRKASDKNSH